MAARDHLSQQLASPADVPAPFGTKPVPEGHVLVNHYTSDEAVADIKANGLRMEKAHESFARGGTEFPSIFATAGQPKTSLIRDRPVVEAHIPNEDLDIGRGTPAADLQARSSTVTTNKDVSPDKIVAVHEPWHEHYRNFMDPDRETSVMRGNHDAGWNPERAEDRDILKGLSAAKTALMAKQMLGGTLSGKQFAW